MYKKNEDALEKILFVPVTTLIIRLAGARHCARKIGVSHTYVARWAAQGMPVNGGKEIYWNTLSDIGRQHGINYSPEELKDDHEKKRKHIGKSVNQQHKTTK